YGRKKELYDTLVKLAEALQRIPGESNQRHAIAILSDAQVVDPEQAIAYHMAGSLYLRLNDLQHARPLFEVIFQNPRFKDYLAARVEFASLLLAVAESARDELVNSKREAYAAKLEELGQKAPPNLSGDLIIKEFYGESAFAEEYRTKVTGVALRATGFLELEEAEVSPQARKLRSRAAALLVQAGSAFYHARDMANAGDYLLRAFRLDEESPNCQELLGAVYLNAAEAATAAKKIALLS
ncbi:MAG: hypothetical protein KDB07_07120, partial [Planctomycetes bacterium]|nr:hypothetical protein [Planctomycetota bacterium]